MALNSCIIHGFRWFFHGLPWRHCRFSGMTGCDRVLIQFWPQMGLLNFIGPYLARIRMSAGVLGWWWFPMSWPNAAGREWTWGNACLSKVSNIHSLQQRCLAWMIAEMLLCLCSFVIFRMVFMYFMFQWVSFGSDWQGYVLPNQWCFGIGWRYEMVGMVSVGDAPHRVILRIRSERSTSALWEHFSCPGQDLLHFEGCPGSGPMVSYQRYQ